MGHVGYEEARAAKDDAAEVSNLDASLLTEESEDRAESGGAAGGEDLRTHATHPAKVHRAEAEGDKKVDGGAEFGERGRCDGWVVYDEGEVVDANGIKKEHLFPERVGGIDGRRRGFARRWWKRNRSAG